MSAYMLSDGTSTVSLYPEWDFKSQHQKIEDTHRARSGRMYRYRWGEFKRVSFDLEYVSSADMTQINSWWASNTGVVLYDPSSTVVISAYIANKDLPIGKFMMPYKDQFGGKIELESY